MAMASWQCSDVMQMLHCDQLEIVKDIFTFHFHFWQKSAVENLVPWKKGLRRMLN
jgi:hypothetical protein